VKASFAAVLLLLALGGCGRLGFGNMDAGDSAAPDASMDAVADAPMDAPADVVADVPLDAAPDVPLVDCVEPGDCPSCQTCNVAAGMCEPLEDGTMCGAGATCRSGACCPGCWAGGTCVSGFFDTQCGAGGGICDVCEAVDLCSAGSCIPRSLAVRVAVGRNHACIVRINGDVLCWGDNGAGQLGLGAADTTTRTVPTVVVGVGDVRDVAVGDLFTCALTELGELHCWGGSRGAAGGVAGVPTRIGTEFYARLAASDHHACAITADGTLNCWGDDTVGELGLGTAGMSTRTPTRVGSDSDWRTISVGARNTCGTRTGAGAFCWGGDATGALGGGCMGASATPQFVDMYDDIWAGKDRAWARLGGGGGVLAWGDNSSTALGTGVTGVNECLPRSVDPAFGGEIPRLMVSGDVHGCANTGLDRLFCWGDGSEGALGHGDLMDQPMPTGVGSDMWLSVSAAGGQTCALNTAQELRCWGRTFGGAIVHTPADVPF